MCGHTHDVVIIQALSKSVQGFGASEDRNLPFPITLAIGFYNSWYYHSCHDNSTTKYLILLFIYWYWKYIRRHMLYIKLQDLYYEANKKHIIRTTFIVMRTRNVLTAIKVLLKTFSSVKATNFRIATWAWNKSILTSFFMLFHVT